MCNTISVHLDTVNQTTKPLGQMIGAISKRITNSIFEGTAEDLAKHLVAPNSKTFLPGIMNGERNNINWQSQKVFALDFDGCISFQQVLLRLQRYELSCTFAYEAFNSTEQKEKFRVIFALDKAIESLDMFEGVKNVFQQLFPELDKNALTSSTMYFGGKDLIHKDFNYQLPLDYLSAVEADLCLGESVNKRTVQRKLAKLSQKRTSLIYNKRSAEKRHTVRNFDFDAARQSVIILNDLFNGKWMHPPELFGLATNLRHIEGGLKKMKEFMDNNGKYSNNSYNILNCVQYFDYEPKDLKNFSPYEQDWGNKNILEYRLLPKGIVRRIKDYETQSLQDAENRLKQIIDSLEHADDKKIHIVKASTGLGKTQLIKEWKDCVLAFPTHRLKKEVQGRACQPTLATPDSLSFADEAKQSKLNRLYATGAYKAANALLNRWLRSHGEEYYIGDDIFIGRRRDILNLCYTTSDTILTTHAMALLLKTKHPRLVFDEDPLVGNLLNVSTLEQAELSLLRKEVRNKNTKDVLTALINACDQTYNGVISDIPQIVISEYDELENIIAKSAHFRTDILGFINCEHFTLNTKNPKEVFFLKQNLLPEDKTVIILSATANEWLYKKLYGDRVVFHDVGDVELQGTLIQDTTHTFSRENMKKKEVLEYAQLKAGDDFVLTFKEYIPKFQNSLKDVYIYNVLGYDEHAGKSLIIIGTPHIQAPVYGLYASALGLKFKSEDFRMRFQKASNTYTEFNFYTFDNMILRNLQFYFIESELRQAYGRARPLRHKGLRVYLMSNYPLPESRFLFEAS